MGKLRKKPLRIPAGAPGHPRTAEASGARQAKTGKVRRLRGRRDESRDEIEAKEGEMERRLAVRARARPISFLYEDEDLVAVDKPAGLAVIPPEGSRAKSLYDIVTDHMRRENPKARAAVVHRLDRDTSGLMVFAKHERAKKTMMDGWDEIVRERRYVALVEGEMPAKSGRLESWLYEDSVGTVREVAPGTRGAKKASTRWKLLAEGLRFSLLELQLETGRKHQIRVQLAALGHPVAGDSRYGSRADPLRRLCLHAVALELAMPGRKELLKLHSAPPPEFETALGIGTARPPSHRPGASNEPLHGLGPIERAALPGPRLRPDPHVGVEHRRPVPHAPNERPGAGTRFISRNAAQSRRAPRRAP